MKVVGAAGVMVLEGAEMAALGDMIAALVSTAGDTAEEAADEVATLAGVAMALVAGDVGPEALPDPEPQVATAPPGAVYVLMSNP